jgi:hypothetical protein
MSLIINYHRTLYLINVGLSFFNKKEQQVLGQHLVKEIERTIEFNYRSKDR